MALRILKLLMIALFLWSCYLQYNDPDGLLWIGFYGLAAVLTALTFGQRRMAIALKIGFVLFVAIFIWAAIGVDRWHVDSERAREAGGILICMLWLGALTLLEPRRQITVPKG